MAVGGSTTVPPWIQALESKYWSMCLCLRAQWWAHFKDLNNNSDGDVASPSTTAIPELHLKESGGHFADYTFFLLFMPCLQPDPCCPHTCLGSFLPTFPAIFSVLKGTLCLPMDSWQFIYSKEMTKFLFFSSLRIGYFTHVSVKRKYRSHQDFLSGTCIRCHGIIYNK